VAADEDAILLAPEGPAEAGQAAADGRVTWTLTTTSAFGLYDLKPTETHVSQNWTATWRVSARICQGGFRLFS